MTPALRTTPAIRAAVPADLPAVAALDQVCFGTGAWTTWPDEFARIGQDRSVLVADPVSGLVGFVVLLVPPGAEDPVELLRIAVAPAQRRTGIGAELMAVALTAVGDRRVLLEVAEGNQSARELYRQKGFAEIGRRRGYYFGGEDAVIMQREGGKT